MAHYNFQNEKLVWVSSFAYLDEHSKQSKYYGITNANQGKHHKINVGHTKPQTLNHCNFQSEKIVGVY